MSSSETPANRAALIAQSESLAAAIVDEARLALMAMLRFMDVALWRMPLASKGSIARAMATDGYLFYLNPVSVIRSYRLDANEVARDYLHAILHCVFRHPFDDKHGDHRLWDLACDIAVESCALDLVRLRFPSRLDDQRRRTLDTLQRVCPQLTAPAIYETIARAVSELEPREGASAPAASTASATRSSSPAPSPSAPKLTHRFLETLPGLFARDDHSTWTHAAEQFAAQVKFDDDVTLIDTSDERLHGKRSDELEESESTPEPGINMPGAPAPSTGGSAAEGEVEGGDRFIDAEAFEEGEAEFASMHGVEVGDFDDVTWSDISSLIDVEMDAYLGKAGIDAGVFEVNLHVADRKVYDYREFLKRFSVLSEEMKVSTEEFDYIYYTYGLARYGNMPLVEPLEYQESRRIREFVIAIDTSASCAGGLVRHFIEKTYDVLRSQTAFGRKVNVHIVQCDCDVRKDTKITSIRDLDDDFGEFKARGFGGTDFRPVFKYVDELVESRELPNLKGMIYLTDGIGKFPDEAPAYETVFVFVNEEGAQRDVPSWAGKVMMTEDEIMEL